MKEKYFVGANNLGLFAYVYDKVESPVAVVQIIHGMQEHAKRYADFARFLNKQNIIVIATDLRGHGKTAGEILGHDDGDIFKLTLEDQKIILNEIHKTYNLPVFVLGHSYGSFLSQAFLLQNPNICGLVLSGSTFTDNLLMNSANFISHICGMFGTKKEARLIENMSLKNYGKTFEDGNWLTRDSKVWEEYKADKFCGKPFPVSFYKSMFSNITKNYKGLKNVNKNLPILLIGGSKDPVSNFGKGLQSLFEKYKKAGLNVTLKMYEDARHEVLNETNKQEVYTELLNFFKSNIKK